MRAALRALLLAATAGLVPLPITAQELVPSRPSRAAVALARRYLSSIDTSFAFQVDSNRTDYVLSGRSRAYGPSVLVVAGGAKARLIWDNRSLRRHDPFFAVSSPYDLDADADGPGNYVVMVSGCAAHMCAGESMGYALWASRTRQVYTLHLTDGQVSYRPQAGMPKSYLLRLNGMLCDDLTIDSFTDRQLALPVKCPPG